MRWSKEKAWAWYDNRPWLRGCNYMSADCANRIDQWQALGFEERFQTTEAELALMQKTGFNTVRLIPEYVVWKEEHDGFMERFDRYLSLCAKYGISCMIVLANDCMPPKNELWRKPYVGEQSVAWGYHGGKKSAQHSSFQGVAPHFYFDDPDECDNYFEMVREIVTTYKNDPRVCIWDVYNEPGAGRRTAITPPVLQKMFDTVRACEPSQPLTSAVWSCSYLLTKSDSNPHKKIEDIIFANSDIISYHYYGDYKTHLRIIKRLKEEGRPIINTEWLGRIFHNDVFSLFPLFYMEKIGCYNWGFVAGKYQTYEPWDATWSAYEKGEVEDIDFTKWFHDLYRPSHHPYDPKEIQLIQEFCGYADDDYREKKCDAHDKE